MRLLRLTANQPGFKTVNFNRTGPTIILARQKDPEKSDPTRTYNGVGKSLIVALVHFCLGARKNDAFKKKLPGWAFSLEFESNGEDFVATRRTSQQQDILLNGKKFGLKEYNAWLAKRAFEIPPSFPKLSFRFLIPAFLRPDSAAYVDYKKFQDFKSDYDALLANGFLLGLDIDQISRKHALKMEWERVRELLANFTKDFILKQFLTSDKDIGLEIMELSNKIAGLKQNLDTFKVAEDYYEIKKEADAIKDRVDALNNQSAILSGQISSIDRSLRISPDLKPETIVRMYEEAKIAFPDRIVSQLGAVHKFYEQLTRNRIAHLASRKNKLQTQAETLRQELDDAKSRLDEKTQYLGAHNALDVFVQLSNQLSDMTAKLERLTDYERLTEQYGNKRRELKEAFLIENRHAAEYVDHIRNDFIRKFELFHASAKRFYPNSSAGITIHNNEGENQIRFNFDARIENDTSDSIGHVKLFCYDLALLKCRQRHHVHFIFHDSRLFDMDERQKGIMFQLIGERFLSSDDQYIATLNENQYNEIKQQLSPADFARIVDANITLRLTDESPEAKLLGCQIDLPYDQAKRGKEEIGDSDAA